MNTPENLWTEPINLPFPAAEQFDQAPDQTVESMPAAIAAGGLRERFFRSRIGRALTAIGTAALLGSGGVAVEAGPANADTTVSYQVTGTEGEGLYIHPDAPTLDSATDGLVGEGGNVAISCWTVGSDVLGDAVWDYGTTADGRQGYLADYYINTPDILNTDTSGLANSGLPECGDASSTSTDQAPPVTAPVANTPPPAPSTPDYQGNCLENYGAEAAESWDNALDMINDDGEFKTQLEQWDTLWGNAGEDDVCVGALFSAPDPSHNNGEYISSVVSVAPDLEPDGCSDGALLEVWGNGFYDSTNCTSATEWHPNIWLKDGSWVCAAISQATDTGYYKDAAAAAAAVDSGQVKLGAADPDRGVTCVEIK